MIIHADCILAMSEMEPSSIDAIITDPPYAISFMSKEFDTFESPQAYLDFTIRWASEALRVLKPGGSLLSFGGTRTFHRLTCGLEDAGFVIKDCLMWLYGQGFPKAQDLGKMIDKRLGAEREVVGKATNICIGKGLGANFRDDNWVPPMDVDDKRLDVTAPASDLARHWDGYKIGGIKPAWEPIIWAVKPPEGAWIDNVLKYGVGAVNVDECRVGGDPGYSYPNGPGGCKSLEFHYQGRAEEPAMSNPKGRFPANLLLSHADGCREVGTKRVKGGNDPRGRDKQIHAGMWTHGEKPRVESEHEGYADLDGYETISAWECAEDCPVRLLDEQSGELSNNFFKKAYKRSDSRNVKIAPGKQEVFCYQDTGGASRFFYTSKATDRQDYNDHPTLKPTDLIEWLIRLVTRPGQLVLDPFAGSGTTGVAAIQSGREFILIEQDSHYIDICERRTTEGVQTGMF